MKKSNIYILKLEHPNSDYPDELLSVHLDKSDAVKYASDVIQILWSEKTPTIRIDKQVIGDGGYYAFKPIIRVTKDNVIKLKNI